MIRDGDARSETEVAVSLLLERGLETLGLEYTSRQIQQLVGLVTLLSNWAARINLTGHRDPLEMTTRLVLDAAALCRAVPEIGAAASLADLGSGAGFPGFPIAILNPHLSVCLIESRLKRNHFQRLVRRSLDLPQVQPILGRSDEVEAVPADVVIAQAMAQPVAALELMRSWASPQGWLILPASENAPMPPRISGFRPFEERSYRVPESGIRRKLWITRREDD